MKKLNRVRPIDVEDDISIISVESDEDLKEATGPTGTVMSFQNVSYSVDVKSGCLHSNSKRILHSISGIMKPGVNAIMGPSGSGKSSLLDTLAGRKDPNGLSGLVLVDGRPLPSNFKRTSGYVVQEDIFLGTLTVREYLWFSANLRLSNSISNDVKSKRIDEILHDLGLTGCADTMIGNEFIRGVSGGEKKRASIGMELITSPSVLFLDEPTTGLDASTANAVMVLLKRLANRGHTIILSIHQPRYSIFRLFDNITLLSLGHLVYHGSYDKTLPYFKHLGYKLEKHNNPADFLLDIINSDSTAVAATNQEGYAEITQEEATTLAQQLSETLRNSDIKSSTDAELASILKQNQAQLEEKGHMLGDWNSSSRYATPFHLQLYTLSRRAFKNILRNPAAALSNIVVSVVIGVVFGLLYYDVEDSATVGSQNRFGVLFFVSTLLLLLSYPAMDVFAKEKHIFIHEYASGYYTIISYLLAKIVADIIPMRTFGPLILITINYWMAGLKSDAESFLIYVLLLLLIGYASISIAFFFSATFDSNDLARIFMSFVYTFSLLFAGLLVNLKTVLPWLAWMGYISLSKYAFSGLCVNEFRSQTFQECPTTNSSGITSVFPIASSPNNSHTPSMCYSITGEEILVQTLGYNNTNITDWDLWLNVVALGSITLGMFTLTYIQLIRTKVYT